MRTTGPIRPTSLQERIDRALLLAAMSLPAAVRRRLAGSPLSRDGFVLDPDTQLLLRLAEHKPDAPLRELGTVGARERLRRSVYLVGGPAASLAEVRDVTLDGAVALNARLYVPDDPFAGPRGLLVYFHGGGWVVGDLETHDGACRQLAYHSGANVLSVEYRLAPEHPFPAPVDDALAAFRQAVVRAEELGADPARVAVGGDSAGGHLAAVTAQLAAADEHPPAFQLLIYPATDANGQSRSRRELGTGFLLTREDMDWYEESFIGAADRSDPRVSPLLANDLEGVAPALVVTAGFDPLRDEGEAYARRLAEAGVPTLLRRHSGFVHGFTHMMIGGPRPREAMAEIGGVLRASLATVPATLGALD